MKPLLLFAMILFVAQCGDESEVVIEDGDGQNCLLEDFDGGSYTFTANALSDGCTEDKWLETFFPIAGEQFGPVEIPSLDELPATVDIPGIPLVGTVPVQVSCSGTDLEIEETEEILVSLNGFGSIAVKVSGILSPVSEETSVEARIWLKIVSEQVPLIEFERIPCILTVQAAGTLQ
jgi:hypothetical protein